MDVSEERKVLSFKTKRKCDGDSLRHDEWNPKELANSGFLTDNKVKWNGQGEGYQQT